MDDSSPVNDETVAATATVIPFLTATCEDCGERSQVEIDSSLNISIEHLTHILLRDEWVIEDIAFERGGGTRFLCNKCMKASEESEHEGEYEW